MVESKGRRVKRFALMAAMSPTCRPTSAASGLFFKTTPSFATSFRGIRAAVDPVAIAAGAATIYRNYFAFVDGSNGQTARRQFNGLADLGEALGAALNKP